MKEGHDGLEDIPESMTQQLSASVMTTDEFLVQVRIENLKVFLSMEQLGLPVLELFLEILLLGSIGFAHNIA